MELDLGDVLALTPAKDMLIDSAANDQPDMERILAFLVQMQEGQTMLTNILVEQKAEIEALKIEVRRIKARTDAPVRSSIIHPGDR